MVDVSPHGEREADVLRRVADFCRLAITRTSTDGIAVGVLDRFDALEPVLETDVMAKDLSSLQFILGEGPGLDAARTAEAVRVPDLRSGQASARWPVFTSEALRLGVGAVQAFPLGSLGVPLGSLMFYSVLPGAFDEHQARQAVAASDLISLALIAPGQAGAVSAGLRMVVHQAAGMAMQQTGGSISDALLLLKATAFSENRSVTELAAEVVAGGRRFSHIETIDGGTT